MEDYFISNKSKSESIIDTSNISRVRTRGNECGDAAIARERSAFLTSQESGATAGQEFLHSNSMISTLCQDEESQDGAVTMISTRTQQPRQILDNTIFMEKGVMKIIYFFVLLNPSYVVLFVICLPSLYRTDN